MPEWIIWAGWVSTVLGALAAIWRLAEPARTLLKRVEGLEERSKRDFARLNDAVSYDKAVAKALIALLNHSETGNNTGAIRAARDELQMFLIER
ncbi:MAG: hypothetical protein LBI64_03685 [Coriobacteriales bacterium]|jgi:hypothetical protein|nr:hypothetical protein [Coriobacteriales bacterium]